MKSELYLNRLTENDVRRAKLAKTLVLTLGRRDVGTVQLMEA